MEAQNFHFFIRDLLQEESSMSDFTGFTYNGKHTSTFHILRVSSGNRYDESVLPTMQNKTAQVPGGDGTYYFGSYYTQRNFNLKLAYDSLTEEDMREIRQWLGDREVHALVFDEEPYKTYYAKCDNAPKFQYICFDENGARVYKGEADLSFVCYEPFGHCLNTKKYLNQFSDANVDEWKDASKLLAARVVGAKTYDAENSADILLYNGGDVDTNICAYYGSIALTKINLNGHQMTLNISAFKGEDNGFRINTYNHLIEGLKNGALSGNLYNDCIVSGDFTKVPLGECHLISTGVVCLKVEYDYLYF